MKTYISLLFLALSCLSAWGQTKSKQDAVILVKGQPVHTYRAAEYERIVLVDTLGLKVYLPGTPSVDYLDATVQYVDAETPPTPPNDQNNTNRNTNLTGHRQYAWRLEYPHLREGSHNVLSIHKFEGDRLNLSLEYDTQHKATRWVCYRFDADLKNDPAVGRTNKWKDDPNLNRDVCIHTADYTGLGSTNPAYDRGHLCASDDRRMTNLANQQTFYTSNCLPQVNSHNRGIWKAMEEQVRDWAFDRGFCDTLYVVKAATIEDNASLPAPYDKGIYGYTAQPNRQQILIPRYFYMALLAVKLDAQGGKHYKALAFWTEQHDMNKISTTQVKPRELTLSVAELQRRTGIDFFCNLPDATEQQVEAALNTDDWTWKN